MIEKPFGEDLESSRELRAQLHEHFDEEQLLRIDHYLGKEAAQNLLVLRFVNGIFEPLWDRRSIESIQVTVAEDGGVDGRGDFYDATGALRDVGQNHLLQLLALALMDAPTRAQGEELRAERLKVLRAIKPIEPADAVLGQYAGYDDEEGVKDGSRTDTYAAMRVEVDSWRWAGVPCYLRTGKRLTAKQAEIAVAFRPSPHMPFEVSDGWAGANRLIIGIQPEHVQLHVTGKRPGSGLDLVKVELDFDAGEAAKRDAPEAYERLLGDALAGDGTLFTSSAEVEAQWAAVEPLIHDRPDPLAYEPGTAGPSKAEDVPGRDGRRWRPAWLGRASGRSRCCPSRSRSRPRCGCTPRPPTSSRARCRPRTPTTSSPSPATRRSGTASPPTGGSTRTASSRCGRRSTSRCTRSPAATGSRACGSRSCSPRCSGSASSPYWPCTPASSPAATGATGGSPPPRR